MQTMIRPLFFSVAIALSATAFGQTSTYPTPTNPTPAAPDTADSLAQINAGVYQNTTNLSTGFAGVIKAIQRLTDRVTQLVGATVDTSAHLMFTLSPDLQTTMSTNYSQLVGTPAVVSSTFNATNLQLNPIFNSTPGGTGLAQLEHYANLTPIPNSNNAAPSSQDLLAIAPFNSGSLLEPSVYSTPAEQADAENFIGFLSFQSLPYSNLPPGLYSQQTLPSQTYRAALGSYAALQSVGLSNLNELYAERQPQEGLGQLAGLKNSAASVQEVEHAMIEQRGLNPQWYSDMENAPPATIARETLYTLAAIQVELYNNNQLLQRMLTTQSAMELMQVQLQVRPKLEQLATVAEGGQPSSPSTGQ